MRLLSLLIILIISFSSTSLKSKETTQYVYAGIIIMSCNNLMSVQKIAAADKVSIALARSVMLLYINFSSLFIVTYTFEQRVTVAISFSALEVCERSCFTNPCLHFFEVVL